MARNNFSSASDRRWQRRYERIQQRKRDEEERKEAQGQEAQYIEYIRNARNIYPFDNFESATSASACTITIPASTYDDPNRNDTLISRQLMEETVNAFMEYRRARLEEEQVRGYRANTHTLDEWFDCFVNIDDLSFGDKTEWSIKWAAPEIPEPELEAGDIDAIDAFLGEFQCHV